MEPLKRVTKLPSEYEVADIIKRFPGWLTALAEGTIENPETMPTNEELLANYFESATTDMRVYQQAGMPNKRYLKGHFEMCDPELLEALRPVIDKKDDTSFSVLHHLLSEGYFSPLKDEVESALHYQQLLGISYVDAAHLVRSFRMYAKGFCGAKITDPRVQPSSLKTHLAIRSIIQAVQEISNQSDWGTPIDGVLRTSDASLGNGQYDLSIIDPDLLSVTIDFPDEIDSICRVMADRNITHGPELRTLAEAAVASLRSGVAPALITGAL